MAGYVTINSIIKVSVIFAVILMKVFFPRAFDEAAFCNSNEELRRTIHVVKMRDRNV